MPGNPLDYWGSDPGNPLSQGAPTWADAVDEYGRLIAQQRQRDIDAGLIDPATGWPTRQGAMQSAIATGTGFGTTDLPGGIRAYHGSPYSFDAFDASKIGTGEGAQAYGHGLYFAENEGIARGYRDRLSPPPPPSDVSYQGNQVGLTSAANPSPHEAAMDWMVGQLSRPGVTPERAIAGLQKYAQDQLATSEATGDGRAMHFYQLGDVASRLDPKDFAVGPVKPSPGSMYEVNIGSDPQHFLDWDKPLSEQSQHVQDAWQNVVSADRAETIAKRQALHDQMGAASPFGPHNPVDAYAGPRDFQQLTLQDPAGAADKLRAAGIPGIRYLDAGSRGAGQGTSNYVVFDPATIAILRKYGIAGLGLGLGAAATQGNAQQQ